MTSATRTAAKTRPGQGEAYWFYGSLVVIRSPDGATPIVIEHRLEPGTAAPLHVHHRLEDSFYLSAGRLAVRCGGDAFVAETGDYVSLPMGVPHTLRVLGATDAVLLQTHTDASFLTFIRSVGVPAAQGRPDMATLDFAAMNRIAGETGQPVLGPPMSEDEAAAIAVS